MCGGVGDGDCGYGVLVIVVVVCWWWLWCVGGYGDGVFVVVCWCKNVVKMNTPLRVSKLNIS